MEKYAALSFITCVGLVARGLVSRKRNKSQWVVSRSRG